MRKGDHLANPEAAALILIAGHAPDLLGIRAQVLRQAGFRVIEESSASQVARIVREKGVDLVLLCHTMSASERERIVREISMLDEAAPIAVVSPIQKRVEPDGIPCIPCAARDLVTEVRAILAEATSGFAAD